MIDSCLSSQHNGPLNEVRHLMYKQLYYPERKIEGISIAIRGLLVARETR